MVNENVKLIKGDCLEVMKEIPSKSVDLIVTDPPYLINYQSNYRKKKYDKIENDYNSNEMIISYFSECNRILKNNTAIYCFCSWHNIDFFKQEFEKYFKLKNIIVWNKNNTSMGDLKGSYAPKHEFVLFGHKGRRIINGFRYPDVINAKKTGNKLHPTQKPVNGLLDIFIETSSNDSDIIFDGFMGSGSTGEAVLKVGGSRKFIGIEKDDNYFNIAYKRILGE
ncbi:MAG: DNA-methyltransferase [Clostridium sp.]|uniref:DNA-methyltransferase n=1 Tax=Clostridium TaxID=1485 RepID=UPI003EE53CA3